MYTFDKVVNRQNTEATKVDGVPYDNIPEQNYPMWVADMDFEAAPEIIESLQHRLDHKVLGYFLLKDRFFNSIIGWHKRRFGITDLEEKHIVYQNSVLGGISHIMEIFTNEGDSILAQSPTYPGFSKIIDTMNRNLVVNPMIEVDGYFTLDLVQFEEAIVEHNIKLYILCNPQNPTGRIWTKEEVEQIVTICLKHNVFIVSDEIWSDMILNESMSHTPLFKMDERAKEIAIALYSPSKAFNLAGMISSYSVCYNEEVNQKLEKISNFYHCNLPCVFAIESLIAAYDKGENWLEECKSYVSGNIDYIISFLEEHVPNIKCRKPDATYLLWLDFSDMGITHEEMIRKMIEEAGVICNDGHTFTAGGDLHMRLNPTTARENIVGAMEAIRKTFA